MKGFKSFADKTNVDFENGVTCVVGPNGSGKSNITDAIRWVLGEQKVKTLRGSKMEDIIFNGTSHRKPLGYAEVSLLFDNKDEILPIDFQEVKVTRKVFRSGESNYLINGSNCRLKDIRDLFMDTGIGIDGYSIIGQGKIDSVLSNKKDDRRQIFDEASEIVKFKNRKNEALRKLDNTEENLIRVNDIVSELESRVGPLKKESERAKEYIEYADRLKYLEINSFIIESETIKTKLDVVSKEISVYEESSIKLTEVLKSKKEEFESFEGQKSKVSLDIESISERINKLSESLINIKSEIEISSERMASCNKEISTHLEEIEVSEKKRQSYLEEMNHIENDVKNLENTLGEKKELEEKYLKEIELYKSGLKDLEKNAEKDKNILIDILNKNERNKSDIDNYKSMYKDFYERSCSLSENINNLDFDILNAKETVEKQTEKNEQIIESLEELKVKKDSILKEKILKTKDADILQTKINTSKEKLAESRARLNVLENMDKNFEGFNYSVKNLMKHIKSVNDNNFHGIVAKLVEIPQKFETAIEVALGGAVQNVVCNSYDDAKGYIEYLKKTSSGRVTFLPINDLKYREPSDNFIKHEGFIGWGNQIVSYKEDYERVFKYLLGNVIVMDNYDNALKLIRNNRVKYRVVTLDGEVLSSNGTVTGGSINKKSSNSIIRRTREIKELKEFTLKGTSKLQSIIEKYNDILSRMKEIDVIISQTDETINKLTMDKLTCESEISNYNTSINSTNDQIERLSNEKHNIELRIKEILEKISSLELDIKINEDTYEECKEKIEKYSDDIGKLQDRISKKTDEFYSYRIEVAKIKEKNQSQNTRFTSIKKDADELEESIANRKKIIEELKIKISLISDLSKENDEKYLEEKEKLEELQKVLTEEKNVFCQIETKIKDFDETIKKLDQDLLELEKNKGKSEINKAKYETKFDNYVQNLWEKYEIAYLEALELKDLEFDITSSASEVKNLRLKLKALGDVNINSIEEYGQVKERYEFLVTQRSDLIDSKKALLKIIKDLENQMIEQFKEKFELIKEQFSNVFIDLFGGGRADLIIKDEENILDSDIDIIAQPPGKKLQNINLMSGGEKALTAISLLFAILRIKPTPFCILDEIEAALDDVNVFRFSEFLREFSCKSQFVVITHRKGTMEIADVLYGITMEEFGVSKLVSLKLDDLEEDVDYA